jgi:hypothetical protein
MIFWWANTLTHLFFFAWDKRTLCFLDGLRQVGNAQNGTLNLFCNKGRRDCLDMTASFGVALLSA